MKLIRDSEAAVNDGICDHKLQADCKLQAPVIPVLSRGENSLGGNE